MDVVDAIARTPRNMMNDKPTHEQKHENGHGGDLRRRVSGAGDLLRKQNIDSFV